MKHFFLIFSLTFSINSQAQSAYSIPHDYSNSPIYTPDFGLIERGLESKQKLYNERKYVLDMRFDNIVNILARVKERQGGFNQSQLEYIKWFSNETLKIKSIDLTITSNYQSLLNWYKGMESTFYNWL